MPSMFSLSLSVFDAAIDIVPCFGRADVVLGEQVLAVEQQLHVCARRQAELLAADIAELQERLRIAREIYFLLGDPRVHRLERD